MAEWDRPPSVLPKPAPPLFPSQCFLIFNIDSVETAFRVIFWWIYLAVILFFSPLFSFNLICFSFM